jgi:hypothetical protein
VGYDDEDGPFLAVELQEQAADSPGAVAVEVSGRLIGQEQARMLDQCPGDGHTLAFAAGQLSRPMLEPSRQADPFQELPAPLLGGIPVLPSSQIWNQHIFQDRALGKQVVVLKNEADLPVAVVCQLSLRQQERILAVQLHSPGGWPVKRAQDMQECALA